MNHSFDTSNTLKSHFKSEDYFPAIVQFSSEELNNRFVEFSYQDTDMFELVADSETGIIKQFTLTLCNHFEEIDKSMEIPDATEGTIFLNDKESIQCDKFILFIYKDGLRINLSDNVAHHHLRCGQLVFALDESDSLVSLYVSDLSTADITHVSQEVHLV